MYVLFLDVFVAFARNRLFIAESPRTQYSAVRVHTEKDGFLGNRIAPDVTYNQRVEYYSESTRCAMLNSFSTAHRAYVLYDLEIFLCIYVKKLRERRFYRFYFIIPNPATFHDFFQGIFSYSRKQPIYLLNRS